MREVSAQTRLEMECGFARLGEIEREEKFKELCEKTNKRYGFERESRVRCWIRLEPYDHTSGKRYVEVSVGSQRLMLEDDVKDFPSPTLITQLILVLG